MRPGTHDEPVDPTRKPVEPRATTYGAAIAVLAILLASIPAVMSSRASVAPPRAQSASADEARRQAISGESTRDARAVAAAPFAPVSRRADDVPADIPMLAGEGPAERLQTLRWMLQAPGAKVVSAFPDLRTDGRASYFEREAIARERLTREISRLERQGVVAPSPSSSRPIARIETTALPPEILAALRASVRATP